MYGEASSGADSGSGIGTAIPLDYSSINTSKNDRNANHNKPICKSPASQRKIF